MKTLAVIAAVIFQIVVLLYMAGEREYILATGATVYLRTAPLDPRDLFRGDYVRLNYGFSTLNPAQFTPPVDPDTLNRGAPIYTQLQLDSRGVAEFDAVSTEPPAAGRLFIRGRVQSAWSQRINVKYGIDAYFVEQGQGLVLEQRRGDRDGVQIPMEMEVALSDNGTAVLKDFRWSPLGIGLEIIRPNDEDRNAPQPVSVVVRLTLQNTSRQALALVMLPEHCSFSLRQGPWGHTEWQLANNPCALLGPADADVIVLQPDQRHTTEIDFSEPRWQLKVGAEVKAIAELPSDSFRLVYQPPAPAETEPLDQHGLIWHGSLPSRAFNGRGRID